MDYTKIYTQREANALYNMHRIKDNPFNYSLKGNLVLNRKFSEMPAVHVQNVGYQSERTLAAQLGVNAVLMPYLEGTLSYNSDNFAASIAAKDTHTYICLKPLQDLFNLDLKGSKEMDWVIKYIVALDSLRSCTNEMFYLTTHLVHDSEICDYENLHNMVHLKRALESKKDSLPVCSFQGSMSTVSVNEQSLAKTDGAIIAIAKNMLSTMEILWAYFTDKDPTTQANFAKWIHTYQTDTPDPILDTFVEVTPTALCLKPGFEQIASADTATRFKFYRDFFMDTKTQIQLCTWSEEDVFVHTNNVLEPLIAFSQCKALYTHRVESLRIMYLCCKEEGLLPDSGNLSDGESALFNTMLEAASESELMPLHSHKRYSEVNAITEASRLPSAISDLDTREGEFTIDQYQYTVTQKRITSEAEKLAYEKVTSKVTLLCKDFVRKVKEIRTYNTGGKKTGLCAGKLDTHAMYRYKASPDIFYNNTYKQLESDLAFGIILDISGSMYGDGIENGKITMILLHEALKNLGINHSIIGHTSNGYHDVSIEKYQSFREEAGYATHKNYALAGLSAKCGNCDSGALHYMQHSMRRVQNKDKIILIFSDGDPTECSENELIQKVRDIEADGIKVIGIGINFPNIARYYRDCANGKNLKDMLSIVSRILQEYILKKGNDR